MDIFPGKNAWNEDETEGNIYQKWYSKDYISLLPSWSEDINVPFWPTYEKLLLCPHGFLVQLKNPGADDP